MRRFFFSTVPFLLLLGTACRGSESPRQMSRNPGDAPMEAIHPGHQQAARWLSGNLSEAELPAGWNREHYRKYAANMKAAWKNYSARNVAPARDWVKQHLSSWDYRLVFYPFGGPDLLNAMIMLPDAEYYLLLGLEPRGAIPELKKLSAAEAVKTLNLMQLSLQQILGHNFFHTLVMAKKQQDAAAGVTALLFHFLGALEAEIVEAKNITLAGEGLPAAPGVTITFRWQGKSRRLYYFQGDISDQVLFRRKGLEKMLAGQKVATMLKAASYLMFRSQFDDMRRLILSSSTYVLQGPSGFPFHYLNSNQWNLVLHGNYVKPIPLFAIRCQPDLAAAVKKKGPEKLPFAYDYTAPTYGMSLIMAAEKKAGTVIAMKYDGTFNKGEDTTCQAGKLQVTRR